MATTKAFSLSLFIVGAAGHGMLVSPPSRNAADRFLPEFTNGKNPIGGGSCNCGNNAAGCDAGVRAGGGGQPCLWFSQGCTIGCETCTGVGSHTVTSLCENPKNGGKHTLPKFAWTMNRNATMDSPQDTYLHNPWRAPGAAPVICSSAFPTTRTQRRPLYPLAPFPLLCFAWWCEVPWPQQVNDACGMAGGTSPSHGGYKSLTIWLEDVLEDALCP
jgi:hypothetical protein